jgi:BRI1 kinase inhibitor 1
MSRTSVGRVGSDLSHARASHHHAATSNGITSIKDRDRDRDSSRAKNKASPFFSGLGGAWRKESSSSDVAGKQQAEEKRKDRAKQRALDVGQWVKRHMASMVEQLRASFSRARHQSERERREQRRRPHSFSGHGPGAAREMRERERWRRRRGQLSSAPASLRVSPANSGHLSVGGSVKVSTSSEESTMEELQSAIEAAIAHCKNSISVAKQTAAAGDDTSKLQ